MSDKVDNTKLVGEFDAHVWADEWATTIKKKKDIPYDKDTMIAWFANAIMAGYDHGLKDSVSQKHEASKDHKSKTRYGYSYDEEYYQCEFLDKEEAITDAKLAADGHTGCHIGEIKYAWQFLESDHYNIGDRVAETIEESFLGDYITSDHHQLIKLSSKNKVALGEAIIDFITSAEGFVFYGIQNDEYVNFNH